MTNNGIINIGNYNTNTIVNEINFEQIAKELEILRKYYDDKSLKEALKQVKNKDKNKLIKCLKKFSKEALDIIKKLSLTALQKLIDRNLF